MTACSHVSSQTDTRKSGTHYLSPALQAQQRDAAANPATLWVRQGQALLAQQCSTCHSDSTLLSRSVASFPKLSAPHADGKTLINLEDQLQRCQQRTGVVTSPEADSTLALSAALHQAALGQRIAAQKPSAAETKLWQQHYSSGQQLYQQRLGRMNLACVHCHDEKVGSQMRGDVVSQAHPTGFPIYRLAWQGLGTLERRVRACYSGVQAPVPAYGSLELRQLELYLKVRAEGMPLEAPSLRR